MAVQHMIGKRGEYYSVEFAKLTGLTYRQLNYWDKVGVFRPSLVPAMGSGSRRRYSDDDLRVAKVLGRVCRSGFNGGAWLRPLVDYLRSSSSWPDVIYLTPDGVSEYPIGDIGLFLGLRTTPL